MVNQVLFGWDEISIVVNEVIIDDDNSNKYSLRDWGLIVRTNVRNV